MNTPSKAGIGLGKAYSYLKKIEIGRIRFLF
jgi:hypothetical protein